MAAMSMLTYASFLSLFTTALASPKVIHMPMTRMSNPGSALSKRAHANVAISNDVMDGLYFVNATVGTPGQMVQLQIDTGSSDVWVFGPNSCDQSTSECLGGEYDPSKSSSADTIGRGDFEIQYGTANSGVVGDYITDDFKLGGITIQNMTMAVATDAKVVPTGIMGIGFDLNEAIVSQGSKPYRNIIDLMASQGLINTRAYSLWLDDLDANTGSCLFGGYDTDKFTGKLLTLPIQPGAQSNSTTSMTIAWTSLSVTDDSDGTNTITSDNFASPALLDSGTTLTLLPSDLYEKLANFFQIIEDRSSGAALVDCETLQTTNGSLNFGFGGSGGPIIKVPFSEYALPAWDQNGNPLQFTNGRNACTFGIQAQDQSGLGIILGDTFLRSAYVVFDLDNKEISLAQTDFNSTSSNIVEIKSGNGGAVGTVISGVTVTATATGGQLPGLGSATATGSSGPLSESGTGMIFTGTALATSTVSPSSKPSGAIATAVVPGTIFSVMVCLASMIMGTAFVVLH